MNEQREYILDKKIRDGLIFISQEVKSMKKDICELKNTIQLTTKEYTDCSNTMVEYQDILNLVHTKFKKFEQPRLDNNIFSCLLDDNDDIIEWSDIDSDPELFDPSLRGVINSNENSFTTLNEIRDELNTMRASNDKNIEDDSHYYDV